MSGVGMVMTVMLVMLSQYDHISLEKTTNCKNLLLTFIIKLLFTYTINKIFNLVKFS